MAAIRLWRYRYSQQYVDDEYKNEPRKLGDVADLCETTPGYFIPTADLTIVECPNPNCDNGIVADDNLGGNAPCPTCNGLGKIAQIPLTAEMLTEMAKGD